MINDFALLAHSFAASFDKPPRATEQQVPHGSDFGIVFVGALSIAGWIVYQVPEHLPLGITLHVRLHKGTRRLEVVSNNGPVPLTTARLLASDDATL